MAVAGGGGGTVCCGGSPVAGGGSALVCCDGSPVAEGDKLAVPWSVVVELCLRPLEVAIATTFKISTKQQQ